MKKTLKRTVLFATSALLIFSFAACSGKKQAEVEGALDQLIIGLYDGASIEPAVLDGFYLPSEYVPDSYYLGSDEVEYAEAYVSEPMISTVPHSIVLLRVSEEQDIEATKKLIKENVDPMKWICVGVEEEDVIVDNIGHLIILIMSDEASLFHDNFKKLEP